MKFASVKAITHSLRDGVHKRMSSEARHHGAVLAH